MKQKKENIFAIILFSVIITLLVLLTIKTKYLYGSTLDFETQHFRIPEYFRTLFYATKDLLPDFALNIGNGQNIYNFSYYGLLSPIILLSYLLPKLSMLTFIQISSVMIIFISTILMYYFLRNKTNYSTCLISSIIFLCSSALLFHSHRHIMYINYMPFLMMGLIGIDKIFNKQKSLLLVLSVFLMIMTSYYFSIPGILALIIYSIYIMINKNYTIKGMIKAIFKLAIPIFIAILLSCILIVPTFYTLLINRSATNTNIRLLELILPAINIKHILYNSYGLGLTSIAIYSLCDNILDKNKEKKFLAIILSLFIIFPVFNYLLNATMYIDSKVLIPLLPLYVFLISISIENIFKNKPDNKKLIIFGIIILISIIKDAEYRLFIALDAIALLIGLIINFNKKRTLLYTIIIIIPLSSAVINTQIDTLITNSKNYQNYFAKINETIEILNNTDKDLYRVSIEPKKLQNVNNITNIKHLSSTVYSSVSSSLYNSYYYDVMNNEIQSRNKSIISSSQNILSLMANANKYIITENKLIGYDYYKNINGFNIYKNEDALPIGYATNETLSKKTFDKLSTVAKKEALSTKVIINDYSNNTFNSKTNKEILNLENYQNENIEINKKNSQYEIIVKENSKITIPLNIELQDKILFVNFTLLNNWSCKQGDITIDINNVRNKLTCGNWKYHNQNYEFNYVIAQEDKENLIISFKKGTYNIKDLNLYSIDYNDILLTNYSKLNLNENTKGDTISGNINVKEDGYLVLSIPYDKGFNIKVDNKQINYELVNEGFIGFKIKKGYHDIYIEYQSPLKNIGIYLSILGLISLTILNIIEKRKTIISK